MEASVICIGKEIDDLDRFSPFFVGKSHELHLNSFKNSVIDSPWSSTNHKYHKLSKSLT